MISKNRKIRKRSSFQNVFFSVFLAVIFIGLVGFLVVSDIRINQKRGELLKRIDELKKQAQILEEENTNLQAGIIETESEIYQEGKLREQGYIKEGEKAVVVLPPENQTETQTTTEKNFFEKILEKIGF
jgi:cell division protein FtsB